MRADEIAIKTAKTGKVNAVVAIMSVFSLKKGAICGALNPGIRGLLCWVRCTHCSDYKAWGASGNYEA